MAPTTGQFTADGGDGDVQITASAATCTWTAVPGASWITVRGSGGGTGSGRVRYDVASQTATSPRSGTLTVAGTAVTINQAAAAAPPPPPPPPPPTPTPTCSFTVSPNPVNVRFQGDDRIDLHVVTTSGCAWTAVSQAGWITIDGAAAGTGDGHVRIAVAPTLAIGGRTGTLLVAGQTVTVTQAGILNEDVTVSGTIAGLSGSCPNRSFTLSGATIVTNAATDFQKGRSCTDLADGVPVRVRGRGQADGTILARNIDRIGDALAPGVEPLRDEE